jgi:hypothetical protein
MFRLLGYAIVILVVLWAIKHQAAAAHDTRAIIIGITRWIETASNGKGNTNAYR